MNSTVYTIATISEFRESFFTLIESAQSIVITAHISPDDDSIASVLSTHAILTKKYPKKNIRVVYTGDIVERYNTFSSFSVIEFVDDISNHLAGVDTVVLLDVSKYSRVSNLPDMVSQVPTRICIDHHASPPAEFTLALIEPNYSSNAELLYMIFEAEQYLDKNLSELFLLGILGDTGNLTFIDGTQTQVFSIVKKLVEVGNIRIDSFLSRYRTIPKRIMPLLQEFVKNTQYIDISGWPTMQYSFVGREFAQLGRYSDEDMSAASHIYMGQYLPRIEKQEWGVVFSPRNDGSVRMSSRSMSGSVNVRIFSESLGNGGGHDRASGASFKNEDNTPVEVNSCIQRVLEFMKNSKPVLS
jgi:nanoRNase/pAp phosphatase (c-di-AMP/oligoRNAs hydrolase)